MAASDSSLDVIGSLMENIIATTGGMFKDTENADLAAAKIQEATEAILEPLLMADATGATHGAKPFDPSLNYKHHKTGKTPNETFREVYGRNPNNFNELAAHFGETRDDYVGTPRDTKDAPASSGSSGSGSKSEAKPDRSNMVRMPDGRYITKESATSLQKLLDERDKGKKK
jgi:hypothetical protein